MKKLTDEEFDALPDGAEYYRKAHKKQWFTYNERFIESPPTPNPDDLKMLVDVASRIYNGGDGVERCVSDAKRLITLCKEAVK